MSVDQDTTGGAQRGSPVGLPDRAAQALAGGGELVLELADPPMDEEFFFWDNQAFCTKMGLG